MKRKITYITTGLIFFISFTMCLELFYPVILTENLATNENNNEGREIIRLPKSSSGFWNN